MELLLTLQRLHSISFTQKFFIDLTATSPSVVLAAGVSQQFAKVRGLVDEVNETGSCNNNDNNDNNDNNNNDNNSSSSSNVEKEETMEDEDYTGFQLLQRVMESYTAMVPSRVGQDLSFIRGNCVTCNQKWEQFNTLYYNTHGQLQLQQQLHNKPLRDRLRAAGCGTILTVVSSTRWQPVHGWLLLHRDTKRLAWGNAMVQMFRKHTQPGIMSEDEQLAELRAMSTLPDDSDYISRKSSLM